MRDLWPVDWQTELNRVFEKDTDSTPRIRVVLIGLDGRETGEVLYFPPQTQNAAE